MPPFRPISRQEFIRYLRELDFQGPYNGGRHQYMRKDRQRIAIPNPHRGEISRPLLAELLRQAGIDRAEWERL